MVAQYTRALVVDQIPRLASPLVGRQRELAFIWNHYKLAKAGCGRVVFLVGEPGIDKTCILDEFTWCVTRDGAVVLQGGASKAGSMPP